MKLKDVAKKLLWWRNPTQKAAIVRYNNPVAASALTNRLSGWFGPDVTKGGSLYGNTNLDVLRARANDMYMNNPHARSAVEHLKSRLIGKHGLSPIIKPHEHVPLTRDTLRQIRMLDLPSKNGDLNAIVRGIINDNNPKMTPRKKYEKALKALWQEFASDCALNGQLKFESLSTQAVRTFVRSGECFVRRRFIDDGSGPKKSLMPFKLQIMDANMSYTTRTDTSTNVVQGIKYDGITPTEYEFYANNPQDIHRSSETVWIKSRDICHIKLDLWDGQVHGLPFLTPCLVKLRDAAKVENNEVLRQATAACFVAFVSGGDISTVPGYDTDAGTYPNGTTVPPMGKMDSGTVYYLSDGESVQFSNPPANNGYAEFRDTALRDVAAALDIPFEVLAKDYSGVNYSSARMSEEAAHTRLVELRDDILYEHYVARVVSWFIEGLELRGFPVIPLQWSIPQIVPMSVDPVKEVAYIRSMLEAGLMSYTEAIALGGRDPEMVKAQIIDDQEFIKENELAIQVYNEPVEQGFEEDEEDS